MALENMYNMRSPAVKRLMKEAQELKDPTEDYYAQPLEDNLFEWHFTVRGPSETEFEGGIYHGRIILPPEYPMKPPSIILLTPNGRFETNKKICLSISGHHPESWRPSWSIRTALLAIIGFMPTPGNSAIGSLDYTPEERKALAKKSHDWECSLCGDVKPLVLKASGKPSLTNTEAREIAQQISFKGDSGKSKEKSSEEEDEEVAETSEASATAAPPVDEQGMTEEERRKETLRLSQEIRQRYKESRQKITERINNMVANAEQTSSPTTVTATTGTRTATVTAADSNQATSANSGRSDGFLSFILIVLLSLAIGGLVTRRIFFV